MELSSGGHGPEAKPCASFLCLAHCQTVHTVNLRSYLDFALVYSDSQGYSFLPSCYHVTGQEGSSKEESRLTHSYATRVLLSSLY